MADLVPLEAIFLIRYGNQLDRNKLRSDPDGVNFVSRSSTNLGIEGKVERKDAIAPFPAGAMTSTMGGTYLLSTFIQPEDFYTAQNVKVLIPRTEMSFEQKAFYCMAIAHNRARYTSHGREANKTFDKILVPPPDAIPAWTGSVHVDVPSVEPLAPPKALGDVASWGRFRLDELFEIERGRGPRKGSIGDDGDVPFITSIDSNNGLTGHTVGPARHAGKVISVNRNGSVGEAFYQPLPFSTTEDVHVFTPKFKMTTMSALFLTTLIRKERYRFGYGRKWGLERMKKSEIRLPLDPVGKPDWAAIEGIMMSLPYSSAL